MEMSTYNPHVNECGICLKSFKEGDKAYHWYEHYVCESCVESPENPGLVENKMSFHFWKKAS